MAKRYSDSFKANVVQKVRDGKTAAAVAREVGASVFSVRDWVRLADRP
jgi:transposase-like protein